MYSVFNFWINVKESYGGDIKFCGPIICLIVSYDDLQWLVPIRINLSKTFWQFGSSMRNFPICPLQYQCQCHSVTVWHPPVSAGCWHHPESQCPPPSSSCPPLTSECLLCPPLPWAASGPGLVTCYSLSGLSWSPHSQPESSGSKRPGLGRTTHPKMIFIEKVLSNFVKIINIESWKKKVVFLSTQFKWASHNLVTTGNQL